MADESIWKKEISFGRKRKDAVEPEEQRGDGPTSIWKKEISFGRKKSAEPDQEPAASEHPVEEPEAGEEPAWTRAVSFGRKAEAEAEAEAEAAPVVEEPAPAEEATWTPAVSFGRKSEAEPVGEAAPEETVVEEPAPVEEATWTRAVSFGRKAEPEPPSEEPAALTDETDAEPDVPEPVVVTPEPVAQEAPAQTWSAQPAPPPVAPELVESAQSEPVAVAPEPVAPDAHAPATAAQLQPVDDEEPHEEKVPFWKKEIGGKKKDKKPKKKAEAVAAATVLAAEVDEKVPFWKKEIGGKKKDKAPKKKVEGTKEKGPKAERAPKGPKQKKQKQPKQPKVKAARGSRGAKRITGLKIGASQLAAARVANNGSAELLQVARTPLEPGIVVGGELRDPDALAEALKAFFAKNGLPKKGVRLGIANNRIGVRTFDIAGISDEKQLTNAIRFRAQETLPIPIDEAVLDYQVLGDGISEDGQPTKRVLLVVAYRDLIDRYVEACKKAGISLIGIDLEAFALLRALQAPQGGADADADAALVAVAIGHDRSTFAVSDGRVCEYTRVLEWGGSALNVARARALDAAPSEVDGIKRAHALTDEMVPEGLTAEQAQKARDSMRRAIQTFARELVSSLQYYQNQPGSLGIGEIVLTGGTAHLAGLAGELERLIGVRVRVGDPLGRMKVSKRVGEAEQVGSLAVAIGLGIED